MFLCEKGTQLSAPLLLRHGTDDDFDFDPAQGHPFSTTTTASVTAEASGAALAAAAILNTATSQESAVNRERRRRQLLLVQERLRFTARELCAITRLLGSDDADVDIGEAAANARDKTNTTTESTNGHAVVVVAAAVLLLASVGAAWYLRTIWVHVATGDKP